MKTNSSLKPEDTIIKKSAYPRYVRKRLKTNAVRRFSSTQIMILGFLTLILLGTLLLMLPVSSADRNITELETALFTSVSATCITGLTVVNTGTYWSLFGQTVIIILVQIGGLGFMTLALMLSIFVKRQITPREQVVVAQSLGLPGVGGTVRLVKRILAGTFIIESAGAIILLTQFVPRFGLAKGIYYSLFHSISAFCNAGFDLLNCFTGFHENYIVCITLMVLIITGGIGFIIWDDIVNYAKKRRRITTYSKFVLLITIILLLSGALLIGLFEWNNPETIGNMPLSNKIFHSFFHSVTIRTAGIDIIGNTSITESTQLICLFFMFIGGASGSTAGGIKVSTFGVLIVSIYRCAKGSTEIVIWNKHIPKDTIIRATTIFAINIAAGIFGAILIALIDNIPLLPALYETISAISNVGLSIVLTPNLSLIPHIILMILMFFGRVGILTITYSIMLKQARKDSCVFYPDVNMMIG